jgi:hypothetical protein
MLDKHFTNRVNTKLTKKRDRSRFTVGSPVVGGDAGSSVDGNGCGVLGGKGFSLPFPNSIF